jgi:hypothetical protein
MTDPFATIEDIETLWRPLTEAEAARATALLPVVSDTLRQAAKDRHYDLDAMIEDETVYDSVIKSVVVDVIRRQLTQASAQPITQMSQTAGSYTESTSYLTPSFGVLVYDNELNRIGLKKRQRLTMIDAYMGIFEARS